MVAAVVGGGVRSRPLVGLGRGLHATVFYKTKRLSPRKALISLLNSSIRKDNSNMTEMK